MFFSWPRKLKVADGISWVMKITDEVLLRVDPEDGRGGAAPVVVALAEAPGGDLVEGHGEAEAEAHALVGRLGEGADGELREVLPPARWFVSSARWCAGRGCARRRARRPGAASRRSASSRRSCW